MESNQRKEEDLDYDYAYHHHHHSPLDVARHSHSREHIRNEGGNAISTIRHRFIHIRRRPRCEYRITIWSNTRLIISLSWKPSFMQLRHHICHASLKQMSSRSYPTSGITKGYLRGDISRVVPLQYKSELVILCLAIPLPSPCFRSPLRFARLIKRATPRGGPREQCTASSFDPSSTAWS